MTRKTDWHRVPAYTPQSGFEASGKFRKNIGLEEEIRAKGVEEKKSILLLGDADSWIVEKIEGWRITVAKGKKKKQVGLGAIEKAL